MYRVKNCFRGGGLIDFYISLPVKIELAEDITVSNSYDSINVSPHFLSTRPVKRRVTPAHKRIRGSFNCITCGRNYVRKDSLQRHVTYECGKDPQFQCPFCPHRCKRRGHQMRHIKSLHKDKIAQDLRIGRPWEGWPPHLSLPLLLMHESMKKTIFSMPNSLDLAMKSPKTQKSPTGCSDGSGFACDVCGRIYKLKSSLRNHQKWECGKDPQFKCPYCSYRAKQKMHMARHMERMHKEIDFSAVKNEVKLENTHD
ncbi:hypothetical protein FQR65_LT05700 [Abscondita terminalis]|nr:hypothetical protein FQR65_LT05700 [Abscondita terminalis]